MFVDIERRINNRTLAVFANATALINAQSVAGIFDNESAPAVGGLAGFESTAPLFTAATADLPNIAQEDEVVIDAVTYKVGSIEPDGTGVTVLVLKK
jgi:hypothetical protein